VCGNTYRHPAVLANAAAAVDQVSHGRLVLGLGAGWQVNEHHAYGIDLPRVPERLDRLEEATQIVLGLLRNQRTTFTGRYYQVTDAPNDPKPVQERLPLLIGGGGERRTMRIAARHADEWNTWSTPEVMAHKHQVLRRHCDDIGRDPAEITVSTQAFLFLSDDKDQLAGYQPPARGLPTIAGTTSQVIETVAAYQDVGVDELIIPDWNMGPLQQRKDTCDQFLGEMVLEFG